MNYDFKYHGHAVLSFVCDMLIMAAAHKYGRSASKFDHRYLMLFLEETLDVDARKPIQRRLQSHPSELSFASGHPDDRRLPAPLANAAIIWLVLNRFPGYEKARFTNGFYEKDVSDGIELYESVFDKIRSSDYARLRSFQHEDGSASKPSYPIFGYFSADSYPIACQAWKAFRQQQAIQSVVSLSDDFIMLRASEAISVLTGNAVDISDEWNENLVDYILATELLDALSVFYSNAIEHDRDAFKDVETLEDIKCIADKLDIDLKVECFLNGVPASDIIA